MHSSSFLEYLLSYHYLSCFLDLILTFNSNAGCYMTEPLEAAVVSKFLHSPRISCSKTKQACSKKFCLELERKIIHPCDISACRQATGKMNMQCGAHTALQAFLSDPYWVIWMLTPSPRNNLDKSGQKHSTRSCPSRLFKNKVHYLSVFAVF